VPDNALEPLEVPPLLEAWELEDESPVLAVQLATRPHSATAKSARHDVMMKSPEVCLTWAARSI